MANKKQLHSDADARLSSLIRVSQGSADEPTRMHARAPLPPVKGQRRGKGKGKPETNLRALALENSEKAMRKVIELTDSINDCVALGASRMVVERGHGKVPVVHTGRAKERRPKGRELKVTITRFNEEKKHAVRA